MLPPSAAPFTYRKNRERHCRAGVALGGFGLWSLGFGLCPLIFGRVNQRPKTKVPRPIAELYCHNRYQVGVLFVEQRRRAECGSY